ncbi:MAG: GIY-YIG nuclease family protein [Candidatus Omnitrophica bacterium]|nr:GIY-YIG nuclease family protein [Candidatus Omnitrophota bacterium]
MYYVYVLQSQKDSFLYIGYTTGLKSRIYRHNKGLVPATKYRRPLSLIFYEAFISRVDAKRRESYFKTTKGKAALKTMLKDYFSLNCKLSTKLSL